MNVPLSKRVFDKYDRDHSGTIDLAELRNLAYELGHFLNDAQLKAAMRIIDKNGDGQITYVEFMAWWRTADRFSKVTARTEADDAALQAAVSYFRFFDKDSSGEVDRNEFKALHADLVKNRFTKLNFEQCISVLDTDGDGNVSFNEYINWLVKIGSLRG